ncbi:MAG: hypothetical protein CVT63_03535 [Candidatus Anoxymicrobium japonicum]|uniref:Thioredoxin domain-containing protein n=1 Tax=Candidatus Anoxymicrobium japonicum TaxID=2013648 RepID=A0A2N3G6U5_9ACTN|nr:MAG: hypothetical protein CVT63_03535 [Candidatus Anoxymicrobium japonicum]
MNLRKATVAMVICVFALTGIATLSGCGQGKPRVITFLGKSSKSYTDTKAMIDKAKKKFGDKIIWENYDYDSPSSKSAIDKYTVSMNPTVIITNSKGQIKQTFMGKPMEDQLLMTIESFIPQKSAQATTPSSAPNSTTVPGTPYPPGATPGATPQPLPQTTTPGK